METLINKVVENFIEKDIVSKEDRSIYEFGLKQGIVIIINLITILMIGLFSGELLNLLIFTVAYLLLRPYAGGYHAESEIGCYIFSILMIVVVVFLSKFIIIEKHFISIILGCSVSILMILAPIEDHHKPLEEMEIKVYKSTFRLVLLFELMVIVFAIQISIDIAKMTTIAIIAITFIVLLGWIKNILRKIICC